MRDIKDTSCVCKPCVFSGAQDVMVARKTHTIRCVCSPISQAHNHVFGLTDRPVHSHAPYFRHTQAHAHTHVNTVTAFLTIIVAFRWDWPMKDHPKPGGHVHSNAVFSATLKAQQAHYNAITWHLCGDGCDGPSHRGCGACLPACSGPPNTSLEEAGSTVSPHLR